MKEAAGEANLTVIAVVLIGIISAIAIPLINNLLKGTGEKSCCTNAGGYWDSATGSCSVPSGWDGKNCTTGGSTGTV